MRKECPESLTALLMSVGQSLHLQAMAGVFLEKCIEVFSCSAAVLLRRADGGSPERLVECWPENATVSAFAENACVLKVPEYGLLVLENPSRAFITGHSDDIQKILEKLAGACRQCEQFQELALKNESLERSMLAAKIGVFQMNLAASTVHWDRQLLEIFGLDTVQSGGSPEALFSRVLPEDREALREYLGNFINEARETDNGEYSFRIVLPDGSLKRLFCHARLEKSAVGDPLLVGVLYDVTEVELARTESLYRSKLEGMLINLSMKVISAHSGELDSITNQALQEVGAYVGADRAYRFRYDFHAGSASNTHEWCAPGIAPEIANLQDTPVDFIEFWVRSHKNGMPFIMRRIKDLPESHALREILEPQGIQSIVSIPLMDNGNCIGFIGFDAVRHERHWSDVDITLLKLLAELLVNAELKFVHERSIRAANLELQAARACAEDLARRANAANVAKSRFVATISHEIRTPMHAILAFSEMLRRDSSSGDVDDHVSAIQESGRSLLALINDVLDLSRIEAGEESPQKVSFSIRHMLGSILRMLKPVAEKKSLEFTLTIAHECPEQVAGDEQRIRQLLLNIIGNAVKFTHHGQVRITAARDALTEATADEFRLFVEIVDTGIGIGEEDRERLFEPFFQVESGDDRAFSGTGLGLSIAMRHAQLLGGEITVKSAPGKGSTFNVSIPLELPRTTEVEKVPQVSRPHAVLEGLTILFAEDNPVNQKLATLHLKGQGLNLVVVENGRDAVARYAESPADMILMDCQMPVLDGFEATRAIRSLEQPGSRVPIIAVTASALEGDRSLCLDAGMDDVLIKPYSQGELLSTLGKWVGKVGA